MRILPFIISTVITIVLIIALNTKWGAIPPLGKFLSPQQGFWQNAEATDYDFNQNLTFKNLKGKVNVYLDERLVPHVFAQNEEDVYFVQGFLHAKFRLWQMEFQTFYAAGRLSEHLGNNPQLVRVDREQRRMGMVWAAENAVKEMEKDPTSKAYFDNYTAGVNAYINSLTESTLPIEYKLLDYKPEAWSNLKVALFLKLMSKDLAGYERDLEFTNAKATFDVNEMSKLFPQIADSLIPIVPKGTAFPAPGVVPVKPTTADSLYFGKNTTIKAKELSKSDPNNGSNNWAVNGTKTKSGAPILCNDPHLGLTLPSIWYEMQLSTPTMNVYGATFPGSPNVIIGFNDSCAFGFTNAQRDVKDYFAIRFKDDSKKEYWFNGAWQPTTIKIEEVKIRGAATLYDTVAYTHFGPVMYDNSFTNDYTGNKAIAVKWSAHEPSNEGAMWFKLDRAKNYGDYEAAIKDYKCPGQNIIFASKNGDIALWQQAKFPARWQGQGLYVMPGEDSSYDWQGYIPQQENPHVINPASGFIESANQRPVDSTYPYFIPGNYILNRGRILAKSLDTMHNITPQDMMQLQNSVYSIFASEAVPFLLKHLNASNFDEKSKSYITELRNWNFTESADSKAATIFHTWWSQLQRTIWDDEFARVQQPNVRPDAQTLLEMLLRDSSLKYADNINTPQVETVTDAVNQSFKLATEVLQKEELKDDLLWWKHKNPTILHLLRESLTPFARVGLPVGGWNNTINATTEYHGPSWRMIVQLSTPTESYGVYPGGESGNPGSKYYDNFVDTWVAGKYYTLWLMKENESSDKRVKWKMTFNNA